MQLSEQLEQGWAPVPATTCETVRDRMARLLEWSYQLPRVCKRHKIEWIVQVQWLSLREFHERVAAYS